MIVTSLLDCDVTRADLKHCGMMSDARKDLNGSGRDQGETSNILLITWNGWDQGQHHIYTIILYVFSCILCQFFLVI